VPLLPNDGQQQVTFSPRLRPHCPEVGFEEIALDLLRARLWPTVAVETITALGFRGTVKSSAVTVFDLAPESDP
jgi:hypothetical protein